MVSTCSPDIGEPESVSKMYFSTLKVSQVTSKIHQGITISHRFVEKSPKMMKNHEKIKKSSTNWIFTPMKSMVLGAFGAVSEAFRDLYHHRKYWLVRWRLKWSSGSPRDHPHESKMVVSFWLLGWKFEHFRFIMIFHDFSAGAELQDPSWGKGARSRIQTAWEDNLSAPTSNASIFGLRRSWASPSQYVS